jgi:ParB family chromosome partitioning protein
MTARRSCSPAPAAGRDRWVELAAIYAERAVERPVDPLLESAEFMGAPSDMRFEMLFEHLSRVEARPPQPVRDVGSVPGPGRPPRVVNKPRPWVARTGAKVATVTVSEESFVLTIDKAVAKDFGEFLLSRMGPLYEEYLAGPQKKVPFHHSLQR